MHKRLMLLAAVALASVLGTSVASAQQKQDLQRGHDPGKSVGQLADPKMTFLSSRLSSLAVYNKENVKLGSLSDLVIDARNGQVLFGILDTGRIVGKRIPVPWNAVQIQKTADRDEFWAVLNISKDRLASAPTFEKRNLGDLVADTKLRDSVEKFFGVRMAARPTEQK